MNAGGQPGNQNAARGRIWRDAINRALQKRSRVDAIEALDELAETLLKLAQAGDVAALKELGDRLEGKPAQQLFLASDPDEPLRIVHESK